MCKEYVLILQNRMCLGLYPTEHTRMNRRYCESYKIISSIQIFGTRSGEPYFANLLYFFPPLNSTAWVSLYGNEHNFISPLGWLSIICFIRSPSVGHLDYCQFFCKQRWSEHSWEYIFADEEYIPGSIIAAMFNDITSGCLWSTAHHLIDFTIREWFNLYALWDRTS